MPHPSLLIVDDDLGTRATFGTAFTLAGVSVHTTDSGSNALIVMKAHHFDLVLLDFRMPDMNGTEVIRRLRDEGRAMPFVLMTAFPTVELTVDAMKLGALDVLEKPLGIDDLVARILPLVRRSDSERVRVGSDVAPLATAARPRSVAERWAALVVRACDSDEDMKTIGEWAKFAGISYSSLCESCRLLDIPPHDARDFARLLRAVVRAARGNGRIESFLYVSDSRTLKKLLDQAGCAAGTKAPLMSASEFIERQHFVPLGNDGLKAVRRALNEGVRQK
jgi:DNA-binding response OmpR family regulator